MTQNARGILPRAAEAPAAGPNPQGARPQRSPLAVAPLDARRGARGRDEQVDGHRRRRRSTARKRKRVGFFFASAPSAASSFWRALLESGRQRERAGGASRVRA